MPFNIPLPTHFPTNNFVGYDEEQEKLKPIPNEILEIIRALVNTPSSGLINYSSSNLFNLINRAVNAKFSQLWEYEISEEQQDKLKAWYHQDGYKYRDAKRKLHQLCYGHINEKYNSSSRMF